MSLDGLALQSFLRYAHAKGIDENATPAWSISRTINLYLFSTLCGETNCAIVQLTEGAFIRTCLNLIRFAEETKRNCSNWNGTYDCIRNYIKLISLQNVRILFKLREKRAFDARWNRIESWTTIEYAKSNWLLTQNSNEVLFHLVRCKIIESFESCGNNTLYSVIFLKQES